MHINNYKGTSAELASMSSF